jgi:hypothetical protein
MKLFDIRMEKTVKKFEEDSYMCQMSSLGNSKAAISPGGQLAVVMTPNGQIVAFDINKEEFVGCLGQNDDMGSSGSSFQYKGRTIIKDFAWQP